MNLFTHRLSISKPSQSSLDAKNSFKFTLHETAKRFYAEKRTEEPLNCKRHLEIYLASGEDVVDKAEWPRGSTKAAPPSADRLPANVSPAAAQDAGGACAPRAGAP